MADEVPSSVGGGYWRESLYKSAQAYDTDAKFFENALKSAHIEGKMGAREQSFSRGEGYPNIAPATKQGA